MYKKLILTVVFALAANTGWAITYGEPDLDNLYPNVASIRGVTAANSTSNSCSGSLVARDADKFVILTAAHCAKGWEERLASGAIQTIGVSFNQNNVINGSFSDATFYLRGGEPFQNPAYKTQSGLGEASSKDVALVVYPIDAVDFNGQTLDEKWPGLVPVNLPPFQGYMKSVVDSYKNPVKELLTIAVSYGTGERFPIPGEEKGPATPQTSNYDTFPIRYIADHIPFLNIKNDIGLITFSINPAKGEDGTCSGDSGGPHFYQDSNFGLIQFRVTSWGDVPCRAMDTGPLLDHPKNSAFVACAFVPGDANAVKACIDALPLN